MDTLKNTGIAVAIAGASFAGGMATSDTKEVIVYQDDPTRVVEVLSQMSVSQEDFDRLVITIPIAEKVQRVLDPKKSDIENLMKQKVLDGEKYVGTGILRADEVAQLKLKVAENKITDDLKLSGFDLDELIRQ